MPSSKIANYGVDLFKLMVNPGGTVQIDAGPTGEFRIDGSLVVTGSTTTVSSQDLNVTDNIITVNSGETGNGVSKTTAGIHVDRGDNQVDYPDAYFLFDENLISGFGFNTENLAETKGAFKFSNETGSLLGIYTSSIRTQKDPDTNLANLYLLDDQSQGLIIVRSQSYEQTLFNYEINSTIISESSLRSPADEDALVNAKALIDYVDSYHLYNWQDRIIALDNSDTRVVADAETVKSVEVIVGNTTIGRFTLNGAEFTNVIVKNEIQTPIGTNLILNPSENVSVSNKRIINLADPINPKDAVNLQYLDARLGNLSLFYLIDPTSLEEGSVLVYNGITEKFEGTLTLDKQTIDAGTY